MTNLLHINYPVGPINFSESEAIVLNRSRALTSSGAKVEIRSASLISLLEGKLYPY